MSPGLDVNVLAIVDVHFSPVMIVLCQEVGGGMHQDRDKKPEQSTKHAARTGQREEHSQSDTLLTNMSDQNGVPRRDRFMKTAIFCSRTASPQTQYYPHAAWCYQTRQPFQDQTLSQNIQTTEIWTTISNFESQRTTRLSRSRLTDTQQPALCRTLSLIASETRRPALHVSSMSGAIAIGMFCVLKYCRQSWSSVCNFSHQSVQHLCCCDSDRYSQKSLDPILTDDMISDLIRDYTLPFYFLNKKKKVKYVFDFLRYLAFSPHHGRSSIYLSLATAFDWWVRPGAHFCHLSVGPRLIWSLLYKSVLWTIQHLIWGAYHCKPHIKRLLYVNLMQEMWNEHCRLTAGPHEDLSAVYGFMLMSWHWLYQDCGS